MPEALEAFLLLGRKDFDIERDNKANAFQALQVSEERPWSGELGHAGVVDGYGCRQLQLKADVLNLGHVQFGRKPRLQLISPSAEGHDEGEDVLEVQYRRAFLVFLTAHSKDGCLQQWRKACHTLLETRHSRIAIIKHVMFLSELPRLLRQPCAHGRDAGCRATLFAAV